MLDHPELIQNFKIPIRKEQLCEEPATENQFFVKDRYTIGALSTDKIESELERIGQKLCDTGGKCLEIINNEYFDFLYSIIYYVEEQNLQTRKKILQLLVEGLKNLKRYMQLRKMFEFSAENMLTQSAMKDGIADPKFKTVVLI